VTGHVEALCVSQEKGTPKKPVEQATFVVDYGIQGDAHAGDWHRQVSMLSAEEVDAWRKEAPDLGPGDFAENVLVRGIDLGQVGLGSRLRLGKAKGLADAQEGKR
jgi:cyclic pyranopterin phosphate synthase